MTGAPAIPGFTYLQHIGQGGFADVFLYEQEWPRQRVAVKVVRPDVPLNDREKSMFTSEANAMARLADHPYIVSVITAGTTSPQEGSRPYLVMRYCPPPDLGQRVQVKPMSVDEALATGVKLASAIETAHRSGILHRDIKPSNVLVTTYSEPALTDFGIAGRLTDVDTDADVRISYPWSPPELLDGRSNGSVASDVYSLGATIWNLLVGRSPFSIPGGDNSSRALTARILHLAPPRTQRADVPPALDLLLQQCLAKEPAHRPASALELARSLQRIETEGGYSRTMIAVETDLTAMQDVAGHTSEDATALKPVSVISGSSSHVTVDPTIYPTGESPRARDRARVLWLAALALVLAAVGLVLFLTAGGDGSTPTTTPTAGASTPDSIAPGAPSEAPTVTGRRTDRGVLFRWRSADGTQPGDTWEWQRADTAAGERTTQTSVTVRVDGRVCLQVRLVRGTFRLPLGQQVRCLTGSLRSPVRRAMTLGARRTWRFLFALLTAVALVPGPAQAASTGDRIAALLDQVAVTATAPYHPGYDRDCDPGGCVFGEEWTDDNDTPYGHNGCDTRQDVLLQQMRHIELRWGSTCRIYQARLHDPYTGRRLTWRHDGYRIEIDHVYPLSTAWYAGAWAWSQKRRVRFANDVDRELLAVWGPANQAKGNSTPSQWLPPREAYHCRYVLRYLQVAVHYGLPVTEADVATTRDIAATC